MPHLKFHKGLQTLYNADNPNAFVQFHVNGARAEPKPAVNVKINTHFDDLTRDDLAGALKDLHQTTYADDPELFNQLSQFVTWEWLARHVFSDSDLVYILEEQAVTEGWEMAQQDARAILEAGLILPLHLTHQTSPIEVHAEGSSGGWLVVEGIPPFDEWTPEFLTSWKEFEQVAHQGAQDIPRQMLRIYLHYYALKHFQDLMRQRLEGKQP